MSCQGRAARVFSWALEHRFGRYAIAVATVALAFGLRLVTEPLTGAGPAFVGIFVSAVVVTSLAVGPGPGLAAFLLSIGVGAAYAARARSPPTQTAWQGAIFAFDGLVIVYLSFLIARARSASARSEARTRELVERAPDAFFLADLDARFREVNHAACRMLGYGREGLLSKTIFDILPAEDAQRLEAVRSELLAPGKVSQGEWRLRRQDGTYVPVEVSSNILRDGRWQAFVRDISERKDREQERSVELEARRLLADVGAALASPEYQHALDDAMRAAVRTLADFAFLLVVEEGDGLKRVAWAARDPAKEGCLDPMVELLVTSQAASPVRQVLRTRRTATQPLEPALYESVAQRPEHLRVLRDAGAKAMLGVPLLLANQVLGVLALVSSSRPYEPRDVSVAAEIARRSVLFIENARLHRKEQQAIQARDDVLRVVAHDLRNPLSLIQLQAQTHGSKKAGSGDEGQSWERVARAAERMDTLIRDLLDVSRIESGHLDLERERLSPVRLLQECVEAHRPLASPASVTIRVEDEGDVPDIFADRARLLRVLENLIGNAFKFVDPGARITAGLAGSEHDEVVFRVADTGPGIPADELPHLFDRFWQAKRRRRGGAGLGLTIARGIVEAHGGHIWVESTVGQGTTFFFTIPRASAGPSVGPCDP